MISKVEPLSRLVTRNVLRNSMRGSHEEVYKGQVL
jgi:hypothetical protein